MKLCEAAVSGRVSNKESVEQTTRVASPYCDTEKGIGKVVQQNDLSYSREIAYRSAPSITIKFHSFL